jgi:hypothetical protein
MVEASECQLRLSQKYLESYIPSGVKMASYP